MANGMYVDEPEEEAKAWKQWLKSEIIVKKKKKN